MVLPLYLAVTSVEMPAVSGLLQPIAYMSCQFSPYTQALTNIPDSLPKGSMLILTDRMPCQGHSPDLVIGQLQDIIEGNGCDSLLLDFQRQAEPESIAMVQRIVQAIPCIVAVSEPFAAGLSCPVLLPPTPLHIPLEDHLRPWQDREIWLEAALEQETVIVQKTGTEFSNHFPSDNLEGGFYDNTLCCQYHTHSSDNQITFTLFDTPESLEKKLELAQTLGVKRAVGLWQELGALQTQKPLTYR